MLRVPTVVCSFLLLKATFPMHTHAGCLASFVGRVTEVADAVVVTTAAASEAGQHFPSPGKYTRPEFCSLGEEMC